MRSKDPRRVLLERKLLFVSNPAFPLGDAHLLLFVLVPTLNDIDALTRVEGGKP